MPTRSSSKVGPTEWQQPQQTLRVGRQQDKHAILQLVSACHPYSNDNTIMYPCLVLAVSTAPEKLRSQAPVAHLETDERVGVLLARSR
jgi:hypothetical protein